MPFLDWLQQLAQRSFLTPKLARQRTGRTPSPRRRCVQFQLEQLEDRITPTGPTLSTLASFNGNNANPHAGLVMDSSGNLYGTTYGGGISGDGTVFKLAAGTGTITTLASFNGTNGVDPVAGLIMDGSGNLYGTTLNGGGVFELAAGSDTIATLASFNGTNGGSPYAGLILDASGNLYGTTGYGGAFGDGTVFELAQGSNTITTLASFNGTNGANPHAGLVMDSSGNLYGTTYGGGTSGDGTVFELAAGSGTITTLASFNGTNGVDPVAGLIMDGSGNLYGTTLMGGASGDGTVFELAAGNDTITTLVSFNGANGGDPYCRSDHGQQRQFVRHNDGGKAVARYSSWLQGSSTITTLATFNDYLINGSGPFGSLIMDSSGNLYGTTLSGGPSDDGTIFELQGLRECGSDHHGPAVQSNRDGGRQRVVHGVGQRLSDPDRAMASQHRRWHQLEQHQRF